MTWYIGNLTHRHCVWPHIHVHPFSLSLSSYGSQWMVKGGPSSTPRMSIWVCLSPPRNFPTLQLPYNAVSSLLHNHPCRAQLELPRMGGSFSAGCVDKYLDVDSTQECIRLGIFQRRKIVSWTLCASHASESKRWGQRPIVQLMRADHWVFPKNAFFCRLAPDMR